MSCRSPSFKLLPLLLPLLLCTSAVVAQPAQLAPAEARITDAVIQRDQATYEALQARLKALNDGGARPVRDYHLAKAQCWLDVSFHEYTRNDRSAFPQGALSESEKLVVAMEGRRSPISMDTELVNGAARLRPDLWAQLDGLKRGPGFGCAQPQIACAEVELVHAGNEHHQQQWRHAKPYVQIAEDLTAQGAALAERCVAPAAAAVPAVPAPAPVPVPMPAAAAAAVQDEWLVAHAVFRFDRSGAADILPASQAQIGELLRKLKDGRLSVKSVRLVGHADRLNGTGDTTYNRRLSERRAATVRELLVAQGIAATLIEATARGDEGQVESCSGKFESKAALQACLLPNRRVEIRVMTVQGGR